MTNSSNASNQNKPNSPHMKNFGIGSLSTGHIDLEISAFVLIFIPRSYFDSESMLNSASGYANFFMICGQKIFFIGEIQFALYDKWSEIWKWSNLIVSTQNLATNQTFQICIMIEIKKEKSFSILKILKNRESKGTPLQIS